MTEKIVMVTGANSGIGRMTARDLAKKGYTVVMVCRNEAKGVAIMDDINAEVGVDRAHLLIADLSDKNSLRSMSEDFKRKYDKLDVLVNNAGVMVRELQKTEDGIEYMMGVNHFGTFMNTHFMLESLQEAPHARIVNVASIAHHFAKLDWDNMNAEKHFSFFRQYALSKLCNIMFTKKLASVLDKERITANSLHPGVIGSDFWKEAFSPLIHKLSSWMMTTPERGAETSIYLASSEEVKNYTGAYFVKSKVKFPSLLASNRKQIDKLWDWSMEQMNLDKFGQV